jgi:carbon storage regulator
MGSLVLSRKEGEEIYIDGGHIVITVVQVERGRVRLAITAPPSVQIDRREVYESKQFGAGIEPTGDQK